MKKLVKIVALSLCLVMLFSFTACSEPDTPDTGEGRGFEQFYGYTMNSVPKDSPQTFEVTLKLDLGMSSSSGGVVLGNFGGAGESINLSIASRGKPILSYSNKFKTVDYEFDYNVCVSEWIHVCITWDYVKAYLYINGEFQESGYLVTKEEPNMTKPFVIGGDLRSNCFKGLIRSVALFSDVRTADEVASDYNSFNKNSDNLLAYYKLSDTENQQTIKDFSSNGNDLTLKCDWLEDYNAPSDYEFSFMVIGDPQNISYSHPEKLKNIYDYVIDNAESRNVKHVFGVGDITAADSLREWEASLSQISRMDGVVPYSVIRGNHDIRSADNDLSIESRFDTYFGNDDSPYAKQYANQYIDCYEYENNPSFKARNTVHEFSSSSRDYLVIALDYGPNDDILAWASSICEAYPNHNVIISTHAYLSGSGEYISEKSSSFPSGENKDSNNGDDIWEEFVSKHENIVMVLCGHAATPNVLLRQVQGVHGNTVSEILVNPQSIDGSVGPMCMVATFYVSRDGKTISVEYYSTTYNKSYKADNHYSFQVATVDRA